MLRLKIEKGMEGYVGAGSDRIISHMFKSEDNHKRKLKRNEF